MVQADSTTNVGIYGLRLWNPCQKKNSQPFLEDMTEEYEEKDNIKVLITE